MCNQKDQFDRFVSQRKLVIKKWKIENNKNKNIGYVSTLAGNITNCGQADGNLSVALFNGIYGLYFDSTNNQLLISDTYNSRIKVLDFNCKTSNFYSY